MRSLGEFGDDSHVLNCPMGVVATQATVRGYGHIKKHWDLRCQVIQYSLVVLIQSTLATAMLMQMCAHGRAVVVFTLIKSAVERNPTR